MTNTTDLREKLKELFFVPMHTADHQNIEPDEITITKDGLDYYAGKLAKIIQYHDKNVKGELIKQIKSSKVEMLDGWEWPCYTCGFSPDKLIKTVNEVYGDD